MGGCYMYKPCAKEQSPAPSPMIPCSHYHTDFKSEFHRSSNFWNYEIRKLQ